MSSKSRSVEVSSFLSHEVIERRIYLIRGKKVMLDQDLADLYQVPTKALNQAVKRNLRRFPSDFMFRLRDTEKKEVVTNCDHLRKLKFSPQLPYAFTDLGVAMLSSILNSERAILANIQIMRTFAKLKELILHHKDLHQKIEEIEKKYDSQFKVVFDAIREILHPPIKVKRQIGFHVKD